VNVASAVLGSIVRQKQFLFNEALGPKVFDVAGPEKPVRQQQFVFNYATTM